MKKRRRVLRLFFASHTLKNFAILRGAPATAYKGASALFLDFALTKSRTRSTLIRARLVVPRICNPSPPS